MEKTYSLTEPERATIKSYQDQFASESDIIDQAKKLILEKTANLTALKGAVQGVVQLIASQQGMVPTGKEKLSIDAEIKLLTAISDE